MTETYRQIVLARRPKGAPVDADFRVEELPVPEPGPGQMLVRTIYMSLDPYMRGRMNEGATYAPGVPLGAPMVGRTVGQVVKSNLDGYAPGDFVQGYHGWREMAVSDGTGSDGSGDRRIDPAWGPISTAIGVLGSPGFTAWVGMMDIGQPKAGETVVVSAASGAVGAVAGQLGKIQGCRVVGIAGGPEKCAYLLGDLGFDAAVDHRSPTLAADLEAACPDGIDIYFENVGGKVFQAVLPLLNTFARAPLCGAISHYNETRADASAAAMGALWGQIVTRRLTLKGFIVRDHYARMAAYLDQAKDWVADGRLKFREDIVEGIENAPRAFQGLLRGDNFGKLLVRLAPDPTRG